MNATTTAQREALIRRLFPGGIARLWCPLLTHYTADGQIDRARMLAHLGCLAPRVKGYLIPGSTGDGWEMSEDEIRQVLETVTEAAPRLGVRLLVGILRTDTEAMRRSILDTLAWLQQRTRCTDAAEAMARAGVVGFTVCPPKGTERSQAEIRQALASILDLGLPTALYQLPQITENEMAPETVAELAQAYPNFYLFKDTSGADRVALSDQRPAGVFLVRGAEGNYARWLRATGGPYDGLLLSTTNTFAGELERIIALAEAGDAADAEAASARLTAMVTEIFALVADLPYGNPFTNANKAIDHFMAHGPTATGTPPPRVHAGCTLPTEMVERTGDVLQRYGLLPHTGYLQQTSPVRP